MSFFAAVRLALGALLAHKGRSFLTSLGIIGIGAVIAVVAALSIGRRIRGSFIIAGRQREGRRQAQ